MCVDHPGNKLVYMTLEDNGLFVYDLNDIS